MKIENEKTCKFHPNLNSENKKLEYLLENLKIEKNSQKKILDNRNIFFVQNLKKIDKILKIPKLEKKVKQSCLYLMNIYKF